MAVINKELGIVEPVRSKTPLDSLIESEEAGERDEYKAKTEALCAFLAMLFRQTNGKHPNALEVLRRLYAVVYTLRPELIDGWPMDKIAKIFDVTKQAFSKTLISQNNLFDLFSRNQKSAATVSIYKEGTKERHAEKKAEEATKRRKEYQDSYRKAKAAELRAYQAQYRAKHRERLNAAKRRKK
jgi:hypothetical protein